MCVGCMKRKQGGKNPPMDFDGGPPPLVLDDVIDQNHFDEFLDEPSELDEAPKLPIPDVRSRSVSPRASNLSELPDENDKGDTIATTISKNDDSADDEWSGFQQNSEVAEEEDDEWGDFAAPVKNAAPVKMEEDEDDEWGAFDQARPSTDQPSEESGPDSTRTEASRQLAHQQSIEEWGAFENATSTAVNVDDDDEWAAEFTSAPPATITTVTVDNLKMLEEMLDDGDFWDDGFLEDEEENSFNCDIPVVDISALFNRESLPDEAKLFENEEKRCALLWLSLRVIEEAISLKFDWKASEIRKNHFKAIKIKVNDVKKEIRSAATMFDTASLLLPTPVQPSSSSTSSDDHNQKTSSSPSVESPSIPAADFDWDVSGLTNPMNRANQSSAIIDVDFLSTNGKATSYTSPLQKELEEFGLTLSNGAGSGATIDKGPNIFETLMSRAAQESTSSSSGRQFRSPEVLSLDARKLLESLPDLQYLQSEVLMFPVGTNLPH